MDDIPVWLNINRMQAMESPHYCGHSQGTGYQWTKEGIEVVRRFMRREISSEYAGSLLGVGHSTISRKAKELRR